MVKLTFTLRRLPHLSREEFQRYWREQHAPLVEKHREVLGIRVLHTSPSGHAINYGPIDEYELLPGFTVVRRSDLGKQACTSFWEFGHVFS